MTVFVRCQHARLLREFVIAYLKGRLVDQFGLASGFASLTACGRLGLRRATLYHCAAKDDFRAPEDSRRTRLV
jgi:hypothetical protein